VGAQAGKREPPLGGAQSELYRGKEGAGGDNFHKEARLKAGLFSLVPLWGIWQPAKALFRKKRTLPTWFSGKSGGD
jgi:hypothetical protein